MNLIKMFCKLVPVDLWTSTTLPPPLLEDGTQKEEAKEQEGETGLTTLSPGCTIEGESFMDGMQVGRMEGKSNS